MTSRSTYAAVCLTIRTMSARRSILSCTHTLVWQALLALTVVAFVARAAIPAGYMPQPGAAGDRSFPMTLCLGGAGVTVVQVSLYDHPDNPQSAAQSDCVYCLVAGQKLLPHQAALQVAGVAHAVAPAPVVVPNHALPPLPALGPPLGSRAPPVNFA